MPCLLPLWFVWDGASLWLSTRLSTPSARNLRDGGRARLALGDTLDVANIDGETQMYAAEEVPAAAAEAFVAKTGWDPRADQAPYTFFRVRPRAVQARSGKHDMRGRHLMRDGVWVV